MQRAPPEAGILFVCCCLATPHGPAIYNALFQRCMKKIAASAQGWGGVAVVVDPGKRPRLVTFVNVACRHSETELRLSYNGSAPTPVDVQTV